MAERVATGPGVALTVHAGDRAADLVLPVDVALVDLVDELGRLLKASPGDRGLVMARMTGEPLSLNQTLQAQGVGWGDRLTLKPAVDLAPPRVYDDPAEAMADAVKALAIARPAWFLRAVWLSMAVVMMAVGGLLLALEQGSAQGTVAAGMATLAAWAATASSGRRSRPGATLVLGWLTVAGAALLGFALVPTPLSTTVDLAATALGAALGGSVALVLRGAERAYLLPSVIAGGVVTTMALVAELAGVDAARLALPVLVLVVIASGPAAELGLAVAQRQDGGHRLTGGQDVLSVAAATARAEVAQRMVVAVWISESLVLAVLGPLAVSMGAVGAAVPAACAVVVLLRTRLHHSVVVAAAGVSGSLVSLAASGVGAALLHPSWRPELAVGALGVGLVALALHLSPGSTSPRPTRLADLAEATALASLIPLVGVGTGVADLLVGLSPWAA